MRGKGGESVRRGCKFRITVESLGMANTVQYPTRFMGADAELRVQLEKSAQATGQSVNKLILACVRVALPKVTESLSPGAGRVTNVEPLPRAVLEAIYSRPEEEDEAGVQQLMAAQAIGGAD